MNKQGHVYKLTHIDGSYFIGSREGAYSEDILKSNFSGQYLRFTVKLDEFTKECLYEGENYIKWRVAHIDKTDPLCLNIQKSDRFMDLSFLSPRRPKRGFKQEPAHLAKLSASRKGKKRSAETREKMREAHIRRKQRPDGGNYRSWTKRKETDYDQT